MDRTGLTDTWICFHCGKPYVERDERCVSHRGVVADHQWMLPVSAVTEAIDALPGPIEHAGSGDDPYVCGLWDGFAAAKAALAGLFVPVEEETA